MNLTIRPLQQTDAKEVSLLSAELGYSLEPSPLAENMNKIIDNKDHLAFVAAMDDQLIGFIHGVQSLRLTSAPFMEIVGLVVKKDYQRQGVATKLIHKLIAASGEAMTIRVRCNTKRLEAHAFYQQLGFQEIKRQKVFKK